MNWAWWDGKMPVEHYREEHKLDTASLAEAEISAEGISTEPGNADPAARPPEK
jgi:hypothetical protein